MTEAKRYLIYVDILGFQDLAAEIAQKTGFKEDVIRENYLSHPLRKTIDDMRNGGIQVSRGISQIEGSDNYVLALDSTEATFVSVCALSNIIIPHRDYGTVPLEIAMRLERIISLELRKRVLNLSQSEARKLGIGKSTLHYLRGNAFGEKAFSVRKQVRTRLLAGDN